MSNLPLLFLECSNFITGLLISHLINVDPILPKEDFSSQEPGFSYYGRILKTVIVNQQGEVIFDGGVQIAYKAVDDVLRETFDLLPRFESEELKRWTFNNDEFNVKLV
ncbi:hypothetical protein [cyanobacterium endosymbiont of Rhopalodia gibberula]|uniref:hypothetical protein n=1 Tax=cyanobacterium endosymbiont of Rhopalodia gibberula TaxID=1763363 RepID=UPI001E3EA431|nr:hypothetical protein [cyanobacterium endosymbiont of Rhopalodia gibberula]